MHDTDDIEVADDEFVDDLEYDDRTPLDKVIDRIGMGAHLRFGFSLTLTACPPPQGATNGHYSLYVVSVSICSAVSDPISF